MADILGNLVLLGTNEDAGTWDFSGTTSFQSGFEPENIGVPGFSSSWRSAIGDTSVVFLIDRGADPPAMGGIIFAGSNLRPSAVVDLRAGPDSGFGSPDYISASEAAVDLSTLGSRPHLPRAGISFGWVFPTALASRYLLLAIDDYGHPDDYVEICAVTGSGYWPMISRAEEASFDRQGEEEQPVLSGPARSGFAVLEQRFPFRAMAPAALRDLQGITTNLLEHDGRIGWVVAPFFDRSTHCPRLGYGVVKEPLLTINPAGAGQLYRSTTLALVPSTE